MAVTAALRSREPRQPIRLLKKKNMAPAYPEIPVFAQRSRWRRWSGGYGRAVPPGTAVVVRVVRRPPAPYRPSVAGGSTPVRASPPLRPMAPGRRGVQRPAGWFAKYPLEQASWAACHPEWSERKRPLPVPPGAQ
ncbi:hypothetical protein GCM10010249_13930 [Streptomyces roseolilacinus]|uniref:Uncharacterized protein n=1 Tax=Streptomyces roseolilacinus TaxID=66904 RepID=A0A918B0S7_9ACTN|nr:hypothetical protein GCM10010249_13930 [Streptomyces roseolilacinus]